MMMMQRKRIWRRIMSKKRLRYPLSRSRMLVRWITMLLTRLLAAVPLITISSRAIRGFWRRTWRFWSRLSPPSKEGVGKIRLRRDRLDLMPWFGRWYVVWGGVSC
ncbi:hypothetical protein QBC44DRAFT_315490, partial [Cladorrhinum sp. PSN332]